MPTPVIPILSVVHEKEAGDVEDALEAAKRYLPIKVFTAHKAVNAVGQAQKALAALGDLPVALLHHKFTAAGKEEFSETLRKFLREKSPDTVVVGWGNGKSAGRQGENYHAFIECPMGKELDVQQLVATIKGVMTGAIQPVWTKGSRSSIDSTGRPSADMGRRPSVDLGRRGSLDGRPAAAGAAPAGGVRRGSMDGRPAAAPAGVAKRGSMDGNALMMSGVMPMPGANTLAGEPLRRSKGSLDTDSYQGSFALAKPRTLGRASMGASEASASAAVGAAGGSAFAALGRTSMRQDGGVPPAPLMVDPMGMGMGMGMGMQQQQPSAFAALGRTSMRMDSGSELLGGSSGSNIVAGPQQFSAFAALAAMGGLGGAGMGVPQPQPQPSAFAALAGPPSAWSGLLAPGMTTGFAPGFPPSAHPSITPTLGGAAAMAGQGFAVQPCFTGLAHSATPVPVQAQPACFTPSPPAAPAAAAAGFSFQPEAASPSSARAGISSGAMPGAADGRGSLARSFTPTAQQLSLSQAALASAAPAAAAAVGGPALAPTTTSELIQVLTSEVMRLRELVSSRKSRGGLQPSAAAAMQ